MAVQTATHTLLYDAGGKYSEQADAGSRIVLPFLRGEGVVRLDGFVVSHYDSDHSGGMSTVLSQMPLAWLTSSIPKNVLQGLNVKHMPCYAGQRWTWDGVVFEMLYPQPGSYDDKQLSDNNRSCVLKIISAAGSVLLSGDIERQAELALVAMKTNNAETSFFKNRCVGGAASWQQDVIQS